MSLIALFHFIFPQIKNKVTNKPLEINFKPLFISLYKENLILFTWNN